MNPVPPCSESIPKMQTGGFSETLVPLHQFHTSPVNRHNNIRQVAQAHILKLINVKSCFNYHNSTNYPSSCLLFKTQLNSTGLSLPHRKHITSPLRDQQVNEIHKFVTIVC
jgi:hypothetical protein